VAKAKIGSAYIQGEKIEIDAIQTINLDDVGNEANIIWLKYKLIDSSDPNAERVHPITGASYCVWKVDSFELGATKESQYVGSVSEIKLARVAKVGSELKVTHDYRSWLKIDGNMWLNYVTEDEFYVGGAEGIGKRVLKIQDAPPVPTRLRLTTGWDDTFRIDGGAAGLVGSRPAYIKAEFGDWGEGTASPNTFTYTSNEVGNWTIDEWIGQFLTCSDGNSWKVVSNTATKLTLETGATPVSGNFWLGPDAKGYKFVIQTLNPISEVVEATAEAENQTMESPVKMEYIWHGLTPDVKYRVKVCSRGGWFQEEWSNFCAGVTITAGGPKEIPDACSDVLDGDVTISAEDDGIRLTWSVLSAYADKVSGFEVCWTDDSATTPDFSNLNHRKIFTDRNFIVLPAKMTSEDTPVIVKAKIRAVDKAGRHCVTPKTLTDTTTKKYPADLSSVVTDYKNIIMPGSFGSLKDFLSQSITVENGRPKIVSEIESEITDARLGYNTLGSRISAILAGNIDWKYVRVVAKSGGQYETIQAAVNSVVTNDPHIILVMPGEYDDKVLIDSEHLNIGIIGFGPKTIIGPSKGQILCPDGKLFCLQDFRIECDSSVVTDYIIDISTSRVLATDIIYVDNLLIKQTGGNTPLALLVDGGIVYLNNVRIKTQGGAGIELNSVVSAMHAYVNDTLIDTDGNCIKLGTGMDNPVYCRLFNSSLKTGQTYSIIKTGTGAAYLYMAHCKYNNLPDEANIIEDYGVIEAGKVSNVNFDADDLAVLL